MKKIFKKACVVLGIMGMGMGTTSCDSDILANIDWTTLLTEVLGNVFNGRTSNVYQGTYSLQHLVSDGKGGYKIDSEKLTFNGTSCEVAKNRDNSVNIIFPGTDGIGDATMTNVNVQNLVFVQDKKNGTMTNQVDLGNNSYIDGKLTVNGKEYEASNLYIKATVTDGALTVSEASIYFGENGEQVINVTFSGTLVQNTDPSGR